MSMSKRGRVECKPMKAQMTPVKGCELQDIKLRKVRWYFEGKCGGEGGGQQALSSRKWD